MDRMVQWVSIHNSSLPYTKDSESIEKENIYQFSKEIKNNSGNHYNQLIYIKCPQIIEQDRQAVL